MFQVWELRSVAHQDRMPIWVRPRAKAAATSFAVVDPGEKSRLRALLDNFSIIEDPREPWRVAHPLPEVLLLALCGTIADCNDFDATARQPGFGAVLRLPAIQERSASPHPPVESLIPVCRARAPARAIGRRTANW